jgi:hypothetical protein
MRFLNHTPLPAAMIPNAEEDDRMLLLFLCAITYASSPAAAWWRRSASVRSRFGRSNATRSTGFVYPKQPGADGAALPQIEDAAELVSPERLFVPRPRAWLDAPLPGGLGWVCTAGIRASPASEATCRRISLPSIRFARPASPTAQTPLRRRRARIGAQLAAVEAKVFFHLLLSNARGAPRRRSAATRSVPSARPGFGLAYQISPRSCQAASRSP